MSRGKRKLAALKRAALKTKTLFLVGQNPERIRETAIQRMINEVRKDIDAWVKERGYTI